MREIGAVLLELAALIPADTHIIQKGEDLFGPTGLSEFEVQRGSRSTSMFSSIHVAEVEHTHSLQASTKH